MSADGDVKMPQLAPEPTPARSFHMNNPVTGDFRIASEAEAIQLGARGYNRLAEIQDAGGWTRDANGARLNPASGTSTPMNQDQALDPRGVKSR